jgi:hypothetical protein
MNLHNINFTLIIRDIKSFILVNFYFQVYNYLFLNSLLSLDKNYKLFQYIIV